MTSFNPDYLLKVLPPNTIPWRVGFEHMTLVVVGMNVQSGTVPLPSGTIFLLEYIEEKVLRAPYEKNSNYIAR